MFTKKAVSIETALMEKQKAFPFPPILFAQLFFFLLLAPLRRLFDYCQFWSFFLCVSFAFLAQSPTNSPHAVF